MFIGIESSVTFRDFSCFLMASEKVLGISLLVRILVLVWVSITVLFRFLGLVSHWYWCGTDSLLYVLLSFGPLWQVNTKLVIIHLLFLLLVLVLRASLSSDIPASISILFSAFFINFLCSVSELLRHRGEIWWMMPFRYLLFNYAPDKLWHYCILDRSLGLVLCVLWIFRGVHLDQIRSFF